jgi:hypothetical protein
MSPHQIEFSARLSRIESGIGSSKSTLYVGMDETYAVNYHQRRHGRGNSAAGTFRSLGYPIVVLLAFLIGVAANVAARFVDFLWHGLPAGTENTDMQLAINFAIALVASSVLGLVFRIRIGDFLMVRVMGIAAGVLLLHNVVHVYPQYFEPVFSSGWVNQIVSSTESGSIMWRGVSIVI